MSRRSTLKRRRERQRRKYQQKKKLALQLPRKISTAALIEELQRRSQILAEIFGGSEPK